MKPEKESLPDSGAAFTSLENGLAVVDLGSNTFQYVAGVQLDGQIRMPRRKKTGVRLGMGGMGQKQILPDALKRAIETLLDFKNDFTGMKIPDERVLLFGTSAFRNAGNCMEVLATIQQETGYRVEVISGEREAELIFEGVAGSGALHDNENQLIIDIGGGSVECILCMGNKPLLKKSFEIGGLRLMEKFHIEDPMPPESQLALKNYASSALEPLWADLETVKIATLLGCSGSFETLTAIEMARQGHFIENPEEIGCLTLNRQAFDHWAGQLKNMNLAERLQIPGMLPLRAAMMVSAVLLIELLLEKTQAQNIRISTFSLKEGALFQKLRNNEEA